MESGKVAVEPRLRHDSYEEQRGAAQGAGTYTIRAWIR